MKNTRFFALLRMTTLITLIIASCNNPTNQGSAYLAEQKVKDSLVKKNEANANLVLRKLDTLFSLMNKYVNATKGKSQSKTSELAEKWDKKMRPYQKTIDSLKYIMPSFMVEKIDLYRQELLTQVMNGTFKQQ